MATYKFNHDFSPVAVTCAHGGSLRGMAQVLAVRNQYSFLDPFPEFSGVMDQGVQVQRSGRQRRGGSDPQGHPAERGE